MRYCQVYTFHQQMPSLLINTALSQCNHCHGLKVKLFLHGSHPFPAFLVLLQQVQDIIISCRQLSGNTKFQVAASHLIVTDREKTALFGYSQTLYQSLKGLSSRQLLPVLYLGQSRGCFSCYAIWRKYIFFLKFFSLSAVFCKICVSA